MPWEPLRDKDSEPKRVSEGLDELMNRLTGTSVSVIETIMDSWSDIVGEAAAVASAPVKLSDGVLTVRVENSVWGTELRWLEPTILERVRALADDPGLRKVKVVVGRAT